MKDCIDQDLVFRFYLEVNDIRESLGYGFSYAFIFFFMIIRILLYKMKLIFYGN